MASSELRVASWNVAAINNNPFEYWITCEDEAYKKLMSDVEEFIEAPGERDVPVDQVFTDEMYGTLRGLMEQEGWEGLDKVDEQWNAVYRQRPIISGFLKDKDIGRKRLTSMPDRVTNTIKVTRINGKEDRACRPTIINMYEKEWANKDEWFLQWNEFMFRTLVSYRKKDSVVTNKVSQLLQPISRAKYPAITEEEEAISIPLQTLMLAVFDTILVHIMGEVAPGEWYRVKKDICTAMCEKKEQLTLGVLEARYADVDVLFLQEAASSFVNLLQNTEFGAKYVVITPSNMDAVRDQNSIVLLRREKFGTPSQVVDLTDQVVGVAKSAGKVPIAAGDLCVASVTVGEGFNFLLASFHGDTNGLATVPVLRALNSLAAGSHAGHKLIFGLDANTYEKGDDTKQGVSEFAQEFVSLGYTSCWGDDPDPKNYTTFNARTFLQPQLNKACRSADKRAGADINPKDFILFKTAQFVSSEPFKDNTGEGRYLEDTVFPTMSFPSDHAIIGCKLEDNEGGMCAIL